jgi:hypothetical protein
MNLEVKDLIDPNLFIAIKEISERDKLVEKLLTKTESVEQFLNTALATIICITDRELENYEKINGLLKANPNVQKFIESTDDQSFLPNVETT